MPAFDTFSYHSNAFSCNRRVLRTVGVPFGLIFGTLQCLPARLFGRTDLPRIQSATYSAILIATAAFGPLVGRLRDVFGGYQAPLVLTFVASCLQCSLLLYLMGQDARAFQTTRAEQTRILRPGYHTLMETI
jgi:hypothetical protein